MTTKNNISSASKPVAYILLPTSPETSKPTTKTNKTQDFKNLSKQPQVNYGSYISEPRNFYRIDLCPLAARNLLASEQDTPVPVPEATEIYIPEDSSVRFQLMDQACGFRKNDDQALCLPRNVSSADATDEPSTSGMKVPSISVTKAPPVDAMREPYVMNMKAPSSAASKRSSSTASKRSSSVASKRSSSAATKRSSSAASKRSSSAATKSRTKVQTKNQKKQDKEKPCFSLDLVLVNPNRSTTDIQHVPIPEATKVTIPGIPVDD